MNAVKHLGSLGTGCIPGVQLLEHSEQEHAEVKKGSEALLQPVWDCLRLSGDDGDIPQGVARAVVLGTSESSTLIVLERTFLASRSAGSTWGWG